MLINISNIMLIVLRFVGKVSAAVTEGVIAAHTKSSEYMKEKMGSLTKGKLKVMLANVSEGQQRQMALTY